MCVCVVMIGYVNNYMNHSQISITCICELHHHMQPYFWAISHVRTQLSHQIRPTHH